MADTKRSPEWEKSFAAYLAHPVSVTGEDGKTYTRESESNLRRTIEVDLNVYEGMMLLSAIEAQAQVGINPDANGLILDVFRRIAAATEKELHAGREDGQPQHPAE